MTTILYTAEPHEWLDVDRVRNAFRNDSGGYTLSNAEVLAALRRLLDRLMVETHDRHPLRLYANMRQVHDAAEQRFNAVVKRLFGSDPQGYRRYSACFIDLLSCIFGDLGEESVRLILATVRGDDAGATASIARCLSMVRSRHLDLDHDLVRSAVNVFFREDDPEYSALQWNLAQNIFIAKVLGLDPSGALLSRELFQGATFYLDTNILIAALEPTHGDHGWFQTLVSCAHAVGAELCVCPPTLEELEAWLRNERQLFEKIGTQIPDSIAPRVNSIFLDIYEAGRRGGRELTVDEVFASFANPVVTLASRYGVKMADDPWFRDADLNGQVTGFTTVLQERYLATRGRRKKLGSARHDAKALTWVERQGPKASSGVWFVTTDRSLPGAVPDESEASSLAITAAALMQWISPVVGESAANGDFASSFAQMIRERLLPPDQFFDLKDFLVFHDMHVSMEELPADEVEQTLREIKAHVPYLDPTDPADQQQISRIVARSLADPGSKHKQEVSRLEADNARERAEREAERAEHRKQLQLEKDHAASAIAEAETIRQGAAQDKLVREAKLWIALAAVALIMVWGGLLYLVNGYEDGKNLLQKVRNSFEFFLIAFTIVVAPAGWRIGKKRLGAIGWPFSSWFRAN